MTDILSAQADGWTALRVRVSNRDLGCMAPRLDLSENRPCKGMLTLNHVKEEPMMGKKAPDDEAHLVTVCAYHHIDGGWATSRRGLEAQRAYLTRLYPMVWDA